jgi:hypothetical protein
MPRSAVTSIDDIVREALEPVVRRASVGIARAIAHMTAARLDQELEVGLPRTARPRGKGGAVRARGAAPARAEIMRWAADRRARRVPNFVIDLTGLKTKKQIVARYGDGVVFEKGKPAPKPK